jgi:putative addiction module CopG family antidote
MPDRQTMNVSLPQSQEKFVRSQVASGRYRSASEVVRDGLRLLEESEHTRLLEKWLYKGLTKAEEKKLPPALLAKAKRHFKKLINEGLADARAGRVVDGPTALKRNSLLALSGIWKDRPEWKGKSSVEVVAGLRRGRVQRRGARRKGR